MAADVLGNPVTLLGGDAATQARLDDFVEGFLASQARVVDVLRAQHDPSPLVQACCAAVHMFAEAPGAPVAARPFITRAQTTAAQATPREQAFIAAVAAWVEGDLPRAIAVHAQIAREHPRDLASLKLGLYHLFNRGDAPGMLRLALDHAPAGQDVPYFHGMLAFALEQCHALEAAESAANQAIALRRAEPWAHHALAHVMLTMGRIHEGHQFLAEVSDTWVGLNSFMLTHNWWHQALFALELDRHDVVLALHDHKVWGVSPDYSQDQVNAVSLLARLELAGVDVGPRWAWVADRLEGRTHDQVLPFLDLHYLLGLARAGRPQADTLLQAIAARAASAADHEPVWRDAALPAAQGVLAWARGEHAAAAQALGTALPRLLAVGGSHAQRDLFAQLHLDALIKSGQRAGAQSILQPWLRSQPQSQRLRRQATDLYRQLGLGDALQAFVQPLEQRL